MFSGIHREDKEISPRYNGHRVTIQVLYCAALPFDLLALSIFPNVSHVIFLGAKYQKKIKVFSKYFDFTFFPQVNRSSSVRADPNHSSSDNGFNSNNVGFKQQQLSSHSVTKKFVSSSSVRKVCLYGQTVHRKKLK